MGWDGPERRSAESLLARAIVAAKHEAEELEAALDTVPGWQMRERRRLKKSIDDARRRESDAMFTLRGR